MDNHLELSDWGDMEDWRPETVARLVARVIREFNEGRYGKDFEAKLVERNIPLWAIKDTLSSKRTYIALYRDDYDGMRRIGFWHPELKLFVAWRPGKRSVFKTCFRRDRGVEYMQRLDESRPIRRPEGRR